MSQSQQALRTRIRSVNSTKKITRAMEMIANAKLFRERTRMEANRSYAEKLHYIAQRAMQEGKDADIPYLKKNTSEAVFTILFASDMGLCGSYNQNVLRYAEENLNKEDPIVLVGTSLYRQLKEDGFHPLHEEVISSDRLTFAMLKEYVSQGIDMFLENKVGRVQVIYTKFINTMTFVPATDVLLPCATSETEQEKSTVETLFEPSPEEILLELIPMMVQDSAYAHWLESTTAEQGSRRMAMKTATDNATDLADDLQLEYNKARQASITQEITEIVGGSEAL